MFRYQVGGGHITIKRRQKYWEGGFVKRRLKFVFITGALSLSTFLLISWRYSVWFDLFVFATLKFVKLRKNIQKTWWVTGKPELEIKATLTECDMKNAHLGDYRRQTMRQVSNEESFFFIFNRPSAPSILTVGQCYPLDKSDQITSQWITTLVSLTVSHLIVGASVGKCLSNYWKSGTWSSNEKRKHYAEFLCFHITDYFSHCVTSQWNYFIFVVLRMRKGK